MTIPYRFAVFSGITKTDGQNVGPGGVNEERKEGDYLLKSYEGHDDLLYVEVFHSDPTEWLRRSLLFCFFDNRDGWEDFFSSLTDVEIEELSRVIGDMTGR